MELRRRLVIGLVSVGVLILFVTGCGSTSDQAVRVHAQATGVPTEVTATVARAVQARTGARPATAVVYTTTLDRAEAAASGDIVVGADPVFLVSIDLQGDYVDNVASVPMRVPGEPGPRPPHGRYVYLIIIQATGDVVGWGISPHSWSLSADSSLGPATAVPLPATS
jgi:hypothetical protein